MNLNRIDELVRQYEAGATIRDLASARKVSPATVRTALIGAGVTLRPRGPRSSDVGVVRARGIVPSYGTAPA